MLTDCGHAPTAGPAAGHAECHRRIVAGNLTKVIQNDRVLDPPVMAGDSSRTIMEQECRLRATQVSRAWADPARREAALFDEVRSGRWCRSMWCAPASRGACGTVRQSHQAGLDRMPPDREGKAAHRHHGRISDGGTLPEARLAANDAVDNWNHDPSGYPGDGPSS